MLIASLLELDAWDRGWVLGMLIGNLCCYFFLYRPVRRLKDEYIARLEDRAAKK